MEKLKKCPFCGGRAVWHHSFREYTGAYCVSIRCFRGDCSCELDAWGDDKEMAMAIARARWNRREGE
jgi:hypothetical protein